MNAHVASHTTPVPESVAIVADVAAQLRLRPAAVAESLEQALFERLDRSVVEGTLAPEQAYVLERCLLDGSLLSLGAEVAGRHATWPAVSGCYDAESGSTRATALTRSPARKATARPSSSRASTSSNRSARSTGSR